MVTLFKVRTEGSQCYTQERKWGHGEKAHGFWKYYCWTPLRPTLADKNQPKGLVAGEYYRVFISTNIVVKKGSTRTGRNTGQYGEGRRYMKLPCLTLV